MNDDNVALFDMDSSLADYNASIVHVLEQLRSPGELKITEENVWNLDKKPHIAARLNLIKSQPGFWLNLAPIQAGMDVLDMCVRLEFHIAILTKGPKRHSLAWDEKLQWCQRHIGEDADLTITFDKSRVYGKILYDDYPDYMLSWLSKRPRGLGIMPVTQGNKDFNHPRVIMYRGLEDLEKVVKAIVKVKNRKPGEELVL